MPLSLGDAKNHLSVRFCPESSMFLLAATYVNNVGPCVLCQDGPSRFPIISPNQQVQDVFTGLGLPVSAVGTSYTEDPYRVIEIRLNGELPAGWSLRHFQSLNSAVCEALEPLLPDIHERRRVSPAILPPPPSGIIVTPNTILIED